MEVIVLADLRRDFRENVNKKARSIFKSYKIDYLFHLAAYGSEGLSHFIKKFAQNLA